MVIAMFAERRLRAFSEPPEPLGGPQTTVLCWHSEPGSTAEKPRRGHQGLATNRQNAVPPDPNDLRAKSRLSRGSGDDGMLFQVSNPCWYRYEVLSLVEWTSATPGQPPPRTVDARVKIYTHF